MILYFWMIIQVIIESLPISSSGHVALMHKIFERYNIVLPVMPGFDAGAFDDLLQGISAVVFLLYFFSYWWQLVVDRPIKISALFEIAVWKKIVTQVLVFGFAADCMTFLLWMCNIDQLVHVPLALGFIMTACALWSIQLTQEKKGVQIWSVRNGLIVGFVQGCALLPGISRFGTTFATLRWLGYRDHDAFSISFL